MYPHACNAHSYRQAKALQVWEAGALKVPQHAVHFPLVLQPLHFVLGVEAVGGLDGHVLPIQSAQRWGAGEG